MAIYHFSAKIISRSKGQSAVASASYRSGEKLKDERTGEVKFYKRDVQPDTMILAPNHAPEWVYEREKLWNEVEKAETRVNSQLAREMEISLPVELSYAQQKELIKDFAQEQFVDRGMVADISIHRDNEKNPHAHIMLTTREISPEGFTNKNRDWNDIKLLENWREQWSIHANKTLEREGINERIDHRSHEERKLETLPTKHLGHQAHAMEKKGIRTERGDYNRAVQEYNKNVVDLQKYREEKKAVQKQIKAKQFLTKPELVAIQNATKSVKGYVTLDKISHRKRQIESWNKSLDKRTNSLNWKHDQFRKAESYVEKLHDIEKRIEKARNEIKSVKDIRGVWEQNKWEGTKKAFERTFNRKEGNQRIEKAEKDIQFLQKHENNFNKYLEPYRQKLNFQTREEFYMRRMKFEDEKANKLDDIKNERAKAKEETQILDKAEKALQRAEVREITSSYPELKHLGDTMRYKDALNLKAINDTMGQTVPINNIKQALETRLNTIEQAENRLQLISNSEKRIVRAESNFNKLDEVQSKIDKHDNNPFLKGKKLFSKDSRQEYEKLTIQRDQLQKAINKDEFSSREDLNEYKKQIENIAQKERPQLEKEIQQAREGKSGISIDQLQKAKESVERAERDYQREQRQRERENEKSRGQEHEIGGR